MDSITRYLSGLKRGEDEATQKIFERFFDRLMALARGKLEGAAKKAADEEDVVQVALLQFFDQVKQEGRFPKLNDRDDLWQVLAMLIDRRATDQIRQQNAKKRGDGQVNTESVFFKGGLASQLKGIDAMPGREPTPYLAEQWLESMSDLLGPLDHQERQVVLLTLGGYTQKEIGEQLETSIRTIQRIVEEIRERCRREDA